MSDSTNRQRPNVVVTGGSGLIGTALVEHLRDQGMEVRKLVRREARYADEFRWDPYAGTIDERALDGIDASVHLSGAGIGDGRWTRARKGVLYDSRVETTRFLAETLASLDHRPQVMVSQSAVGIYGDRGDEILTEDSAPGPGDDFLSRLVVDWERAATPAVEAGIRVVHPRTGIVLSDDAALMRRLLPLYKAGLGGPLGDGNQWWSWVSLRDVVSALSFMVTSEIEGPHNVAAPEPLRQREFSRELASVLGRPSAIPAPKPALKLVLGPEKAEGIALSSTRVSSALIESMGFRFSDTDLEQALRRLLDPVDRGYERAPADG